MANTWCHGIWIRIERPILSWNFLEWLLCFLQHQPPCLLYVRSAWTKLSGWHPIHAEVGVIDPSISNSGRLCRWVIPVEFNSPWISLWERTPQQSKEFIYFVPPIVARSPILPILYHYLCFRLSIPRKHWENSFLCFRFPHHIESAWGSLLLLHQR